jgi:hypothetical protein
MKFNVSKIKFFNSVKASSKGGVATQLDYVDINAVKIYEIIVDGILVKIYNLETHELTYSTLNNVVYFVPKE